VNGVRTALFSSFPLCVEELETEIAVPLVLSIGNGGALSLLEVFSFPAEKRCFSDWDRDKDRLSGFGKGRLHCRIGHVSSVDFER
jgi:hypothetical protein